MGVVSLKAKLKKQTLKEKINKTSNGKCKHGIQESKAIICRETLAIRDYKHGSYSIYHVGDRLYILIRGCKYRHLETKNLYCGKMTDGNYIADIAFIGDVIPLLAKYFKSDRQTLINQLKRHAKKHS